MPCRFAENPLVLNEPFIRFYAGAPLITSTGHRLGSLCIIDRKPRELEAESCNVLINFAEVVMRELEKEKMRVRGPQTLVSCAPLSRAAASNLAGMCASEICDSKASGLKQWHGSSMRKRCGKPVHQLTSRRMLCHNCLTDHCFCYCAPPGLILSECCRSQGGLSAEDMHGILQALEAARMKSQTSGLLRAFDAFKEGIMICSSSSPSLEILFFNDAWCKLTGRFFLSCPTAQAVLTLSQGAQTLHTRISGRIDHLPSHSIICVHIHI